MYNLIKNEIQKQYPDAEVPGTVGRTGALEVVFDGKVIWSKLNGDGKVDSSNVSIVLDRLKKAIEAKEKKS